MNIDPAARYHADGTEGELPDGDAAAALLLSRRPELVPWILQWQRGLIETFGDGLRQDATRGAVALGIALARMGLRHGSWGEDFHAYHNENHALELMDGRMGRLLAAAGEAFDGRDRIALMLFCACHDLRQREEGEGEGPVGPNEAASIAESARILAAAGFDARRDAWLYSMFTVVGKLPAVVGQLQFHTTAMLMAKPSVSISQRWVAPRIQAAWPPG